MDELLLPELGSHEEGVVDLPSRRARLARILIIVTLAAIVFAVADFQVTRSWSSTEAESAYSCGSSPDRPALAAGRP